MRISAIYSTPVTTIDPSVDVAFARRLMNASALHHLVVVRDGKVLGVLSQRDVIRHRPRLYDDVWRVRDIMSAAPITITTDATVSDAAQLMHDLQVHCLPVMRGDELVGIITAADLLALLVRREPQRTSQLHS